MTLNELKQQEEELNEIHNDLIHDKEELFSNKERISLLSLVCETNKILDKIIMNNNAKIANQKAQIELLTN